MPIYEYRCKKCSAVFEEWHKRIDVEPVQPCPQCQGEGERIVSNTTFMLKGSGWHVTDYAKTPGGTAGANATPSEACAAAGCAPSAGSPCAAGSCPAAASASSAD